MVIRSFRRRPTALLAAVASAAVALGVGVLAADLPGAGTTPSTDAAAVTDVPAYDPLVRPPLWRPSPAAQRSAHRQAAPEVHRASPLPTHSSEVSRPARRTHHSSSLLVEHLNGVGDARQVISVVASGYGTSYATLQGFTKTHSGWERTFGPWSARIGRNGFAPSGEKREGDGRTPSGSYGFQFMFGTRTNPGVRYEYRHITGDYYVWADDPGTPRYNLWTDTRTQNGGPSPEPMNNSPSYNYGAVIAYNTARVSGMGSAIFFHVSHGSSTAGCVAIPESELLEALRWMDPAKSPRIIMGTESAVT